MNRKELIDALKAINRPFFGDDDYWQGNREWEIICDKGVYKCFGWGKCFSGVIGPETIERLRTELEKHGPSDDDDPENGKGFELNISEDMEVHENSGYIAELIESSYLEGLSDNEKFYFAYEISDDKINVFHVARTIEEVEGRLLESLKENGQLHPWDDMSDGELEDYGGVIE